LPGGSGDELVGDATAIVEEAPEVITKDPVLAIVALETYRDVHGIEICVRTPTAWIVVKGVRRAVTADGVVHGVKSRTVIIQP
jgi:hypothetical protein